MSGYLKTVFRFKLVIVSEQFLMIKPVTNRSMSNIQREVILFFDKLSINIVKIII